MYNHELPPDCPVAGAVEADIALYRILIDVNMTSLDLVSHAEKKPRRFGHKCEAHGLSFFTTYEDALKAYNEALTRNKPLGSYIAKIQILPNHGRLHSKEGNHYTLWIYHNVSIADFQCLSVERIED